jgi:hypothetical protein
MKTRFIVAAFSLVIVVGCSKLPNLGKGYQLDYNSDHDLGIVNSKNSYLVYGHITNYSFDSRFILAEECPRDSVPACTGRMPGMTLKKCDEAFKKSTFHQYWIIDKEKKSLFDEKRKLYSNVYGPFKKDEYMRKREEVGVPQELKLKD